MPFEKGGERGCAGTDGTPSFSWASTRFVSVIRPRALASECHLLSQASVPLYSSLAFSRTAGISPKASSSEGTFSASLLLRSPW